MLDPTRLKLCAESVGYQARFGRPIDWVQFDKALQTDYNNQGSAIQVRREKDTPVNEIRVMGAQQQGFESNSLLLTNDRQARQINGYPLRQFSAENPAVVIPRKYGGLPMYTRNQTEYNEYVSRFTEPLSAQLDSQTALLSKAGLPALTEDISRPYDAPQFVNPMTSTRDELEQNQNIFRQRMHLQRMASKQRANKRGAQYNMFYNAKKQNILVSADGHPVSNAADAIESEKDELELFGSSGNSSYAKRQLSNIYHVPSEETSHEYQLKSNLNYERVGLMKSSGLHQAAVSPSINSYDSRSYVSTPEDATPGTVAMFRAVNLLSPHASRREQAELNNRLDALGRSTVSEADRIQSSIKSSASKSGTLQYNAGEPERIILSASDIDALPVNPMVQFQRNVGSPQKLYRGSNIAKEVNPQNILHGKRNKNKNK